MKQKSQNRTPVLSRLVKVQALTLLVCFGLLFALQYYLSTVSDKAALLQLRDHLQPKIEQRYEKWLAWKVMGLDDALQEDIAQFSKGLPIKSVEFLENEKLSDETIAKSDSTIVLPQKEIPGLPLRVKVSLDKKKIPGADLSDRVMKIMFLCLAGVFILITTYTMWYLKKFIHRPMLELTKRMHQAENGKGLSLSDLETSGEIKLFAESVLRMHTKSEEAQKTAAVVQTVQMIAHDVRKPFSILRTGLEILKTSRSQAETQGTVAKLEPEVIAALSSVNNMLQDILDMGTTHSKSEETSSIGRVVHDSVLDAGRMSLHKHINISWDLSPGLNVTGDSLKLKRVLTNIIANAFEAEPNDGTVWLKSRVITKEGSEKVEIAVGNAGSYIEPEVIGKVFSPFFTKNKKGGTGLGLAIARKIVHEYGGEIFVDSSKKAGTEFRVILPKGETSSSLEVLSRYSSTSELNLKDKPVVELTKGPKKTEPEVGQHSNFRVVVLDDNPFILDGWQSLLGDQIAECYTDPKEFLDLVDSGSWDSKHVRCIISDYHFGDSSAYDGAMFAKEFKQRSELPILLSSDIDLGSEDSKIFAGIIPKCPLNLAGLKKLAGPDIFNESLLN